jgi:hypothetical protein
LEVELQGFVVEAMKKSMPQPGRLMNMIETVKKKRRGKKSGQR